jgi:hypothetical protein
LPTVTVHSRDGESLSCQFIPADAGMNKKPPVAAYRGQSLAVSDEETAGDGRLMKCAPALSLPAYQDSLDCGGQLSGPSFPMTRK